MSRKWIRYTPFWATYTTLPYLLTPCRWENGERKGGVAGIWGGGGGEGGGGSEQKQHFHRTQYSRPSSAVEMDFVLTELKYLSAK